MDIKTTKETVTKETIITETTTKKKKTTVLILAVLGFSIIIAFAILPFVNMKATSLEIKTEDIEYKSDKIIECTVTAEQKVKDLKIRLNFYNNDNQILNYAIINIGNLQKGQQYKIIYDTKNLEHYELFKKVGTHIESGKIPLLQF